MWLMALYGFLFDTMVLRRLNRMYETAIDYASPLKRSYILSVISQVFFGIFLNDR